MSPTLLWLWRTFGRQLSNPAPGQREENWTLMCSKGHRSCWQVRWVRVNRPPWQWVRPGAMLRPGHQVGKRLSWEVGMICFRYRDSKCRILKLWSMSCHIHKVVILPSLWYIINVTTHLWWCWSTVMYMPFPSMAETGYKLSCWRAPATCCFYLFCDILIAFWQ